MRATASRALSSREGRCRERDCQREGRCQPTTQSRLQTAGPEVGTADTQARLYGARLDLQDEHHQRHHEHAATDAEQARGEAPRWCRCPRAPPRKGRRGKGASHQCRPRKGCQPPMQARLQPAPGASGQRISVDNVEKERANISSAAWRREGQPSPESASELVRDSVNRCNAARDAESTERAVRGEDGGDSVR